MLFLLSTLLGTALAQSGTMSASGAVQTVMVGEGGLNFVPDSLTAGMGDQIVFRFVEDDHSVAQGMSSAGCVPADNAFFSGFGLANNDPWTLTINSSDPIYFYCSEHMHCQAGMVGVINPPSDSAVSDYASMAADATSNVSPSVTQGGVFAGANVVASASSSSMMTTGSSTMMSSSETMMASSTVMESSMMTGTSSMMDSSSMMMSSSTMMDSSSMASASAMSSTTIVGAAPMITPFAGMVMGVAAGLAMI